MENLWRGDRAMTGTFNPGMTRLFGSADRSASSLDDWYLSVARPVAAKSVSGFNVVADDRHYVKDRRRFRRGYCQRQTPRPEGRRLRVWQDLHLQRFDCRLTGERRYVSCTYYPVGIPAIRFWAIGTRVFNLSIILTDPFALDRFKLPCISLFHHTPVLLFHSQPPPDSTLDDPLAARYVVPDALPVGLLRRQVKHLEFDSMMGPAFCHCHIVQFFKFHFNRRFARRNSSAVFVSTSEATSMIFASLDLGCRFSNPRFA